LTPREQYALSDEERGIYKEQYDVLLTQSEEALKKAAQQFPPVDVSDFVDHIDYLVDAMGIDYVGISSDFDGGGGIEGWKDASETFNVTLELVKRGYTEEAIGKIWSGNLLRVLTEVENIAARLQAE
jgi:microsomal dipeptidase-like Zn-dependent dipeptidase